MHITGFEAHQHSATLTTDTLRVMVRSHRDSVGRVYDEVVVQSLGGAEPEGEIRGRQTRIIRVPLAVEEEAARV